MQFPRIPSIDAVWDSVSIKALSPSSFSWVNSGCRYQIILNYTLRVFNDAALYLPSNRNAILGTIVHKIYELTTKGELSSLADLKNKWEELIEKEKNILSNKYPTLSNPSLNDYDKRNCTIRYALRMMNRTHSFLSRSSGKRIYSEKWLDCSEIGLKGAADKIILDSGCVDIIDFKSGNVKDWDNNIKTEYYIQLHLYAAMCEHLSLGSPRHLILVDINGEEFAIPYSYTYRDQLLSEVKDSLDLLNNAIAFKQFRPHARPELGMCSKCNCRHICQYREISPDELCQTISGIVVIIPSTNMYVIQSRNNTTYYISGLDEYDVDTPVQYIGKNLVFVNVIRASQQADNYTFKTTANTLIYELL